MLWRTDQPRWYPPGFIQPCLPTPVQRPPCGPQGAYEIKHDGYRLMVRKTARSVRIFTRRGADWSHRFPRIVAAVSRLPASSIMLDGEGVICGQDGVTDFNALHSKERDDDAILYAFDLLRSIRRALGRDAYASPTDRAGARPVRTMRVGSRDLTFTARKAQRSRPSGHPTGPSPEWPVRMLVGERIDYSLAR
jgi:hypothetical protein